MNVDISDGFQVAYLGYSTRDGAICIFVCGFNLGTGGTINLTIGSFCLA